jgi:hypothetical protein
MIDCCFTLLVVPCIAAASLAMKFDLKTDGNSSTGTFTAGERA